MLHQFFFGKSDRASWGRRSWWEWLSLFSHKQKKNLTSC